MSTSFRFKNLDSIRTIAFVSTFLAHAFGTESAEVRASAAYRGAIHLREVYTFGVPVFFVLSGFLISYLMLREQETIGALAVIRFYVRRALRIWPLYFLVLLFGFLLFPVARTLVEGGQYQESASPLYYLLFLSNFDQIRTGVLPYGVGLGPTWSISVEEQFYLVWPLFLALFPRRRFLLPIIAVFVTALVLSPVLNLPAKHTLFSMIYLSAGAAFGYAAYYHEARIKHLADTPDYVALAVAGFMLAAMYLSAQLGVYWLIPVIGVAIAYLIVQQCYTRRFDLGRIPLLERAGKYTYGLYMYHSICIFLVHALFQDVLGVPDTAWLVVGVKPVLSLILSALVSYGSYHYFERFFLRLKQRRFTPLDRDAPGHHPEQVVLLP